MPDPDDISSLLDGVPVTLPALERAVRVSEKAASVGFDWQEAEHVLAKIEEELDEVRQACAEPSNHDAVTDEIGDLLFAVANLARKLGVDPEAAAHRTIEKFRRRFAHIEAEVARRAGGFDDADLELLERLWVRAKNSEPPR